jgi:hypothetical protein
MTEASESRTFSSREEAVLSVLPMLRGRLDCSDADLKDFVEQAGLVSRVTVARPDLPPTAQPAVFRSFRYVIRDDDLYDFGIFLDLMKALLSLAVGAASLPTLAGFKSVGDALHGLFGTFKAIKARGVQLEPVELLVVNALRYLGTASPEMLAEMVRRDGVEIHARAVDAFLQRHERHDNKGFTRRAAADAWCLDGV